MKSSLPLPAAVWRRAIASMASLVLAAGAAAPHDVALEPGGALARTEIAASAVHPGAPAHAEDAEFEVHPACPACLLQIHTRAALGGLQASPSLGMRDDEIAAREVRIPSRDVSLLAPARAPPTLSPSV